MTTVALEQHMESTALPERPHPSQWRNPGVGPLDRETWLNAGEVAILWFTTSKTVREYSFRIPHITGLGGHRYFHKDLVTKLREEFLLGNDLNTALINLGIEQPTEPAEEA